MDEKTMPRHFTGILASGLMLAAFAAPPAWAGGTTERVSVGQGGVQANGFSDGPAISADGRFVAFESVATNLVPYDTNGTVDVFVRDRMRGTTERASIGRGGRQANGFSESPAISADGRFVAFASNATNLVANDTDGVVDVFVRDRLRGVTEKISVLSDGSQRDSRSPAISADGRFVAFCMRDEIFLRDRRNNVAQRLTHSSLGWGSCNPAISPLGRFVAFNRSHFFPGDDSFSYVFIRDRLAGAAEEVDVPSRGGLASSFINVPSISAGGRFVTFGAWTGADVIGLFLRDRQTGAIEAVSVSSAGVPGNAFSEAGKMTPNGRFIAFGSFASNLVPGDVNGDPDNQFSGLDVFVRDRLTRTTQLVSVGPHDVQSNDWSDQPAISADGRFVAFHSSATNLVPGDTNDMPDVFVRDRD